MVKKIINLFLIYLLLFANGCVSHKSKCQKFYKSKIRYFNSNETYLLEVAQYIVKTYFITKDTVFTIRFSKSKNEVGSNKFFKINDMYVSSFYKKIDMKFIEYTQNKSEFNLWFVPEQNNYCDFITFIFDPNRTYGYYNNKNIKLGKILDVNHFFYLAIMDDY